VPYVIEVEDSDFPLIVVRAEGRFSDDEVRTAISTLEQLLEQKEEAYALLVDVREADLPSSEQLEMIAASFRTNEQPIRTKLVGLAFVTANPATVAAIRALSELAAIPVPTTIEAGLSRARSWTRARMSESQV
jgi:hypothetical protein